MFTICFYRHGSLALLPKASHWTAKQHIQLIISNVCVGWTNRFSNLGIIHLEGAPFTTSPYNDPRLQLSNYIYVIKLFFSKCFFFPSKIRFDFSSCRQCRGQGKLITNERICNCLEVANRWVRAWSQMPRSYVVLAYIISTWNAFSVS